MTDEAVTFLSQRIDVFHQSDKAHIAQEDVNKLFSTAPRNPVQVCRACGLSIPFISAFSRRLHVRFGDDAGWLVDIFRGTQQIWAAFETWFPKYVASCGSRSSRRMCRIFYLLRLARTKLCSKSIDQITSALEGGPTYKLPAFCYAFTKMT